MVIAEKDFVVCRKAVGLDSEHEVPRQLREKLEEKSTLSTGWTGMWEA